MTVFGWWQGLTLITRFLGLGASTSAKKKPGFYEGCWLVARVDVNYPVSGPKEETRFLVPGAGRSIPVKNLRF